MLFQKSVFDKSPGYVERAVLQGLATGFRHPMWDRNQILGGNEGSVETYKFVYYEQVPSYERNLYFTNAALYAIEKE